MNLFRMLFEKNVSLDIGTTEIRLYLNNTKVYFSEPNIIVINGKKQTIAAGSMALKMPGRLPKGLKAPRTLEGGLVTDTFALTELLRTVFTHAEINTGGFKSVRVYVGCRRGLTDMEKSGFLYPVLDIGNVRVVPVDRILAAAFGEGYDGGSQDTFMIADIGQDNCGAAVLTSGGVVSEKWLDMGMSDIDSAIISEIRLKYQKLISAETAEKVRMELADVTRSGEETDKVISVRSVDLHTGLPTLLDVNSGDIRDCVAEFTAGLTEMIGTVIQKTPVELSVQLEKRGLILVGGGAMLNGLSAHLEKKHNIPVRQSGAPTTSQVRGMYDAAKFSKKRSRGRNGKLA